jgi:RsiW-degrading membrane proteinase PrsW (M82 family)
MVTFLRKRGFAIYWIIFAVYTLQQAQIPGYGFYLSQQEWHYPWDAVLKVWVLLAVLVGLCYAIIRPASYNYSWRRLTGALIFSVTLLVLAAFTYMTDMPGYYYVPFTFSMISLVLILLFLSMQVEVYFRQSKTEA